MKKVGLIIALLLLANSALSAQTDSNADYSKNCIYLDGNTMYLAGSLSVNYERLIGESSAVRVGLGYAYVANIDGDQGNATAVTIMYNYLTPGENKFELGVGLSYPFTLDDQYVDYHNPYFGYFSFCLGYRYQSNKKNGIIRFGISKVYYFGSGLHLSLGYVF